MSVLRRLVNVAYGKVRAWQAGGGDEADDGLARELDGIRVRDELRERGLRERWTPPVDDTAATGAATVTTEAATETIPTAPAEPRPRRL